MFLLLFGVYSELFVIFISYFSPTLDRANSIEDTGVGSVYDDVFERTEEILKNIKAKLESANITKQDTEKLQEEIEGLAEKVFFSTIRY